MRTLTIHILLSTGALMACGERAAEPALASAAQATVQARGPAVDAPPAPATPDLSTRVAADLKRLQDLQVVELGGRAGAPYDEASVARLDRFTALAEEAAAVAAEDESAEASVEKNLEALRSLELVEVETLVYDEPSRASHCYGPCPPSSKAEHRRAVQLAHIARATKGL